MATILAEAPVQNRSTELLQIYESDGLYALLRQFPNLADDLGRDGKTNTFKRSSIGVERTVVAFQTQFKYQWVMARMTAAIPPDGLRAILKGTVAYDDSDKRIKWYDANGPGIYLVGLAVEGRRGMFLSRNEIEDLRRRLQRYCDGYQALVRQDNSHQSDINFVKQTDRALGTPPSGRQARFIDNRQELERALVFRERLGSRCNMHLDPTGDVIQIQSPLYVGCSDKLQNRTKDYLVKNPTGVNKLLTLTMSLIKGMGLTPKPVVRVALLVWEDSMLARAERLVAALASSYVSQHGFNATEAGGQSGVAHPADLVSAEKRVFGTWQHMTQNLESAIRDMDKRIDFIDRLNSLSSSQDDLAKRINEYGQPSFKMEVPMSVVKERANTLNQKLEDRRRRHHIAMKFDALNRLLFPDRMVKDAEHQLSLEEADEGERGDTEEAPAEASDASSLLNQDRMEREIIELD
ncbi:hypothetical protein NM208_g9052 [Fusarium decemcellulare]|uniref:Uncharacterized protein n=1 Tax=Fusarium decemcellulare TaxID=57161 RepID=A0ACC1S2Y5_9HYPO|nr:hypothetical protein NM208_g9052 [Fusarium decemcellulare]